MPLLLDEADVARALDMAGLIPLMRETLMRFSRGDARQPVRHSLTVHPGGGFYGVMPAHVPPMEGRRGALGLKSVSFYPKNDERGLPTHLATILLLDPDTGALEAIVDGRLITEMRTAAVSAVSVQLLAREGPARLALIGAGVQARSHLEAIALVRPLEEVRVWSRKEATARRFAEEAGAHVPCPVKPMASVQDAVRGATIVATVCSAIEPVLEGAWLEPGMHLCVVGSSSPRRREVDTDAVLRSRVFIDSREAGAVEAGDLLIPVQEGRYSMDRIVAELGDVAGGAPGRGSDTEITLFKSLGLGVEDLASARLALEGARTLGLGTTIAL
jgi:alanine dehydrogenase